MHVLPLHAEGSINGGGFNCSGWYFPSDLDLYLLVGSQPDELPGANGSGLSDTGVSLVFMGIREADVNQFVSFVLIQGQPVTRNAKFTCPGPLLALVMGGASLLVS